MVITWQPSVHSRDVSDGISTVRHQNSLVLALALSGDLAGAIENLQRLLDQGAGADMSDEEIRRRQAWIRVLEQGAEQRGATTLYTFENRHGLGGLDTATTLS